MVTDRQMSSSGSFTSSMSIFGSVRRKKVKPAPAAPTVVVLTAASIKTNNNISTKPDDAEQTSASSPTESNEIILTAASSKPPKSAASPAASSKRDWNDRGWIRIYCGPYRDHIDLEESSRMVNVAAKSTAADVAADLDLPAEYALWLQTGGADCRRLRAAEHPLLVQEAFCTRIGWTEASRRARLAIDPQLKYLLRFYVGPAAPAALMASTATTTPQQQAAASAGLRSGFVDVLKGLVAPQWRKRAVAIVGGWLLVYPGECIVYFANIP